MSRQWDRRLDEFVPAKSARTSRTWRRYEAKYFIDEACATRIRAFLHDNVPPDPHSACMSDMQYPVYSVYLDSPTAVCFHDARNKAEVRAKLRVRTYRSPGESASVYPHFYEIKRKRHGIVKKTRARLPAELGEQLIWNGASLGDDLGQLDSTTRHNLASFQDLRSKISARPAVAVFYTREAYETTTADRVRISLDRNLHAGLLAEVGTERRDIWWPVDLKWIILEIKFTDSYPFWVADLIRSAEVSRRGVCKYVMCSRAVRMQRPVPS